MAASSFPKLLIEEGPSPGEEIELNAAELIIGREPGAGIVLPALSVSRRHARLFQQGQQYLLEDLGSSNGTYVNGTRIETPTPLHSGDILLLGQAIRLKYIANNDGGETIVEGVPGTGLPVAQTLLGPQAETEVMSEALAVLQTPPQLQVIVPGLPVQTYNLIQDIITVGRSEDNDIFIPSPIVSARHTILEKTNTGYRLKPHPEAANPVLHKGVSIGDHYDLIDGDVLQIGWNPAQWVTLLFHDVSAPPSTAFDFGEKSQIQIGRDLSNDVVLNAPSVSRFHALVERIGQRYRVRDLRSANGVFVNDKRISGEAWVSPADVIRIGSQRFFLDGKQLHQYTETPGVRVEARGLQKWVRKDLNLLQDISLVFKPREFIVIVGQSGGGKSTLLDAISGYRPATHGKVIVNGVDIYQDFDSIRSEIGFVPQKDIIHMELTVYQALDYAARLRMPADTTSEERRQRILEVLQDLDLAHRKDVKIGGLSGGQQKRVSIGVELLTKPGLFFLDEPTSGLDPGAEAALMQLMRKLADQGRTIVLITHATKNVALADKVVFLARGGFITWFGPPDQALSYFDQYRTERERRTRPMEFDEIYALLDNPERGSPAEWATRFNEHPAYRENILEPLQLPAGIPATAPSQKEQIPRRQGSKPGGQRVSGLRQFGILSARNIRILTRDRIGLILMLASAPIIGLIDVVLALVLGRDLFNYTEGSMANAIIAIFQPIIFGVMIGIIGQMREFVKEADIYKRERLVNLKVLPYVLSKVWVAALLALYQAGVYTIIHYLSFKMPGGALEFGLVYVSIFLATLAGMMLGLLASAIAPNANTVQMIVVLMVIPQFVLGGALIPIPDEVTAPISARWGFESMIAITGLGADVAADACWSLPQDDRLALTDEEKETRGCICLGLNALDETSCNFPGLGEYYLPALDAPEPAEPQAIGDPPAEPDFPAAPEQPSDLSKTGAVSSYLQALQTYQAEVDQLRSEYKNQVDAYQAKADNYSGLVKTYQEDITHWKIDRSAAVGKAEATIETFFDNYGWAFVNKADEKTFWSHLMLTWGMQGAIILTVFAITLIAIYRKDR